MELNNREKFLVVILAAAVILLGGFKLLIEPQIKSLGATNTELLNAVSNKQQADYNVLAEESVKAENKSLASKIKESSDCFFPKLENDEIQIFFQGLADKTNVKYNSFTMTNPVTTQISEFVASDNGLDYPAKDAANEINNIDNGKTESTTAATSGAASNNNQEDFVEMMTVALQFNSTPGQAIAFVDEIKNSGKLVRISSFNMTLDDKGIANVNIAVECFGVVKIAEAETVSTTVSPTSPSSTTTAQ